MRRVSSVLLSLSLALAVISPSAAAAAPASQPAPASGIAVSAAVAPPAPRDGLAASVLIAATDPPTTTVKGISSLLNPAPADVRAGSVYGRIRGSAAFVRRVKAALDWLQAHDAGAYQRVDTYITVITPSPYARLAQAEPLPGGGCAVRALARWGMSAPMTAAILYHEASHCFQFATAGVLTSKEAEVFAYTEQIAFMERNGFAADDIGYYRKVLAYYASQPDDGQFVPPPDF